MPTDREEKLKVLEADLETVKQQVQHLYFQRMLWRRFRDVVGSNPQMNKWNPFYDLIIQSYVTSAALAVRRLLDRDSRTVSFATIVERLCDDPGVITRSDYVSQYPDRMRSVGYADRDFDRFAGPGGQKVSPGILEAKMANTAKRCEPIREYVNKIVAHRDRTRPSRWPKYRDVDKAIDAVGDLLKELVLLFRQSAMIGVVPTPQYDWEWVFQKPWLPADEGSAG